MPVTHLYGPLKNALADSVIGSNSGLSASVSFVVMASKYDSLLLQVRNLGGTAVAATSGCRVQVFRRIGMPGEQKSDTVAMADILLPTSTAAAKPDGEYRTLNLSSGDYEVKLTNQDVTVAAANAVTVSASIQPVEVRE
jgi:hypothetical protein